MKYTYEIIFINLLYANQKCHFDKIGISLIFIETERR